MCKSPQVKKFTLFLFKGSKSEVLTSDFQNKIKEVWGSFLPFSLMHTRSGESNGTERSERNMDKKRKKSA